MSNPLAFKKYCLTQSYRKSLYYSRDVQKLSGHFEYTVNRASRSASSRQRAGPFYNSRAGFFFGKASHRPFLSAPIQLRFVSLRLLAFPKAKIAFEK